MDNITTQSYHALCEEVLQRVKKNLPFDKNLKIYNTTTIKKMVSYYETIEEYEKCKILIDFINRKNHTEGYTVR